MTKETEITGSVTGSLKIVLRLEGLAAFITSLMAYGHFGYSWKLFFILFLFPNISFAGYLLGKTTGALAYNALHSYILPLVFGVLCWHFEPSFLYIPLIWITHIGFDRVLGYGLKYTKGFGYTHLGMIKMWGK
ncbi:MAG: hypothetical protein B7Y25_03450 [Alphaproteobacteria bacterium 16-39-46]|nr:MAG: hypothetical protein B7Y25_03450 [Alphaproteobacteria bacterium 16-39-46]OZA43325.1 MAG: hypothetical protein B7X84_03510 [Alphaproteobacteria bacterium 17-39-52]HQS83929.1 DUF4260 domain-containing protein [Alphaproteobacteria bacterium]HQS93785.1 DUF4260 domain-containing protein [Alphaproteobacteria bacterium]